MNSGDAETTVTSKTGLSDARRTERVFIPINGVGFPAELVLPANAKGLVLCVIANGCVRETERLDLLPRAIEARDIATLSFPLLTHSEAEEDRHTGSWSFELDLLTRRLLQATSWAKQQPQTRDLGIGYTGTSTFATAAFTAAAQLGYAVQAVVSRAGRTDFAVDALPRVTAPSLLIVGERDEALLKMNRRALEQLQCPKRMLVVPGAGHLFDDPGTLEQVGGLAADWFSTHLQRIKHT